ncbi:MAG: hypothetical protein BMS9Abin36_2214 [Gammaproteobacteria bacterium]|nr:MAG: hypothetical protein BMS9Abin36_2214 [Gammaproteobacteria bacterium]
MTSCIKQNKSWQWLFIVTLLYLFTLPAQAAIPDDLDYQGYLTDSSGSPVNSSVNVTFLLYNVGSGGIALWGDTQSVAVNNGLFTVKLGGPGNPFPLGLFNAPLWLGIDVAGDGEMSPRITFSSAAFAHKADDAFTLEGSSASSLDQSAHVTNTGNPHGVTATQTGAISSASFTLHTDDASAHHSKTTSFTDLTDQAADAQLPAAIARDAEIMPTVLGGDGSGSTLDADLLDGLNSTAFMTSGTDIWVNTTGDTMTGGLNVLGNVGIGTTTPGEKLAISLGAGSGNIASFSASNNPRFLIGVDGVDTDLSAQSGNNLKLGTAFSGTSLTILNSSGNVGIGMSNPGDRLDVAGGVVIGSNLAGALMAPTDGLRVEGQLNLGTMTASLSKFSVQSITSDSTSFAIAAFNAAGTNIFVARSDGNVGIGMSNPGDRLDVNGNLFMSGGDIRTDRWLLSDTNTGIGVDMFGAGNLSHTTGFYEGWYNTAIGNRALFSNSTGFGNTANGARALQGNTTGSYNTANGYSALNSNDTGSYNTANGFSALLANTTGSNNTANGYQSLSYNITGNNNIALGYNAGDNLTSGSNNIIIGYNIDAPVATGSNQMSIGNLIYATGVDGTMTTVSTGRVGIGTASPGYKLEVSSGSSALPLMLRTTNGYGYMGAGNAGYFHFYTDRPAFYFSQQVQCNGGCVTFSDINKKKDLEPVTAALEKITRLNGVTWSWKEKDLSRTRQMGLIAQNVEEVAPELVEDTTNGKTMNYDGLSALTVEAIKELKAENDELRAELEEIKSQLERLGIRKSTVNVVGYSGT